MKIPNNQKQIKIETSVKIKEDKVPEWMDSVIVNERKEKLDVNKIKHVFDK